MTEQFWTHVVDMAFWAVFWACFFLAATSGYDKRAKK
jgi:hypothetical protein